jgi:uncharacterized protein
MKNMFIDIYEIAPEGVVIDAEIDFGDRAGRDDVVLEIGRTRLTGRAVPGKRGVDLRARVESSVQVACCRCLEPMTWSVSEDFYLALVPEATEFSVGEAQVTDEDASLYYSREGKADLVEIALEQVHLGLPLKPLCDPDCRGLCPTCGANRNEIECGCREESIDPRLAPLLELRNRKDGDGTPGGPGGSARG